SKYLEWLNANAPELETRLREAAKRDASEAQRSESERMQLQSQRNRDAILQFSQLTLEEKARVDVDARWGGYADKTGLGELKVLQRKAITAFEKGDAIQE